MKVVYLNDYYLQEESVLKNFGIPCKRLQYPFEENLSEIKDETVLVRGPKFKNHEFQRIIEDFKKINCRSVVSPDNYKLVSDAIMYSKCFGKFAPSVISFSKAKDEYEISKELKNMELKYPVFVRSDIESAAKYVGVDSCILKSNDVCDVANVLAPINTHIPLASTIIMKEIIPIKKINNTNIEYRALVINGNLLCFDYSEDTNLPNPQTLSNYKQFYECVETAKENGLNGTYFVDFAVDETENIFVVECKNIINGTIKHVEELAKNFYKVVD